MGDMFYKVFRSITVDNGVEFSDYEGMERSALKEEKRTFVFYCHPYSSWERGTNENNNRLIRRHIPKGVDFEDTTDEEIKYIETWINMNLQSIVKCKVLVCAVSRDGVVEIPGGHFILREGDHLFITATSDVLTKLLRNLGIITHKAKACHSLWWWPYRLLSCRTSCKRWRGSTADRAG